MKKKFIPFDNVVSQYFGWVTGLYLLIAADNVFFWGRISHNVLYIIKNIIYPVARYLVLGSLFFPKPILVFRYCNLPYSRRFSRRLSWLCDTGVLFNKDSIVFQCVWYLCCYRPQPATMVLGVRMLRKKNFELDTRKVA